MSQNEKAGRGFHLPDRNANNAAGIEGIYAVSLTKDLTGAESGQTGLDFGLAGFITASVARVVISELSCAKLLTSFLNL